MNAIFKMLLYLALVIIVVLIAYANGDQDVDVTYFPGYSVRDIPVFLVILGAVFAGVLIAGVISVFEHFKHGRRERELQRRIQALESEVRELRNLPISGSYADAEEENESGWVEE
jgi:uncharacterized integral membrane protein